MGDTPGSCILMWCETPADAGPWCREDWDRQVERDVKIAVGQSKVYLAAEVVRLGRQLDFLAEQTDSKYRYGMCCGHLLMAHTHGGCNGLIGDAEAPCRCQQWAESPSSTEAFLSRQDSTRSSRSPG